MFIPKRIIFEKNALEYETGLNIYNFFKDKDNVEIIRMSGNRIKSHIPGDNLRDFYSQGKNTIVVGVKKSGRFQSCKPSAHWQLPLISGCAGQCEYCYLNTNLGDKPYIKINVNIEDILSEAQNYIDNASPSITIFEGSATSDPIPVEPYTGSLKRAIEFFAESSLGRFRFVTKYNDVDTLLNIDHNNHTDIRFTLNTAYVINNYEHKTASVEQRLKAAAKISEAGYGLGFIIAPIFIYDNWKEDYHKLLIDLRETLSFHHGSPITFEVISHRYTMRAKNIITEVFPNTSLPMKEEDRQFKYGQFGYGKYVYPKDIIADIKAFFTSELDNIFEDKIIKYII